MPVKKHKASKSKKKQVIEGSQEDPRVQESNKTAVDVRSDSCSTRRGNSHQGALADFKQEYMPAPA